MNKPAIAATAWPFPTSASAAAASKNYDRPAAVIGRVLLMAVGLHEGSYDHEASDAAQAEANADYDRRCAEAREKGDNSYVSLYGPDYAKFYRQRIEACCWVAAKHHGHEELAQLALLALHWSTDAIEWAQEVTERKYERLPYDAALFANVPRGWRSPTPEELAAEDEGDANDDTFALPA